MFHSFDNAGFGHSQSVCPNQSLLSTDSGILLFFMAPFP